MRRVHWRPLARRDAVEITDYLAQDSLKVARRFRDAAEQTMYALLARPYLGAVWETANSAYSNMRCWPVKGFPKHLIFYRPITEGIEVFRIIHGARDLDAIFGDE